MKVLHFRKKGEITLFLTLFFSVVMAFISVMIKTSYRIKICNDIESLTDLSLRACFSEYCVDLYDRYGIKAVDLSYKFDKAEIENFNTHFNEYMIENFDEASKSTDKYLTGIDSKIKKRISYMDFNGVPFMRAAVNYVSKKGLIIKKGNIKGKIRSFSGNIYNGVNEIIDEEFINSSDLSKIGYSDIPSRRTDFAGGFSKSSYSSLISNRNNISVSIKASAYEEYFDTYILNYFSGFSEDLDLSAVSVSNTQLYDCKIKGEIEYIIVGKTSDYLNLKEMVERLFRIELYYSGFTEVEDDSEDYEDYFSYGSAYYTAKENVKDLLNGLTDDNGYSYQDYLIYYLKNTDEKSKYFRTMDIMETNLRSFSNPEFRMDKCMIYCENEAYVDIKDDKVYSVKRQFGCLI